MRVLKYVESSSSNVDIAMFLYDINKVGNKLIIIDPLFATKRFAA